MIVRNSKYIEILVSRSFSYSSSFRDQSVDVGSRYSMYISGIHCFKSNVREDMASSL